MELDDEELENNESQLAETLLTFGIKYQSISLKQIDDGCFEFTGQLQSDHPLPLVKGKSCDRRAEVVIRGLIESQETGRPVIWGEIEYSVDRDRGFFFPVPEEYGERVSIKFGWEFDGKTLKPSYADVRERNSIHYVSVLPCDEMRTTVDCFANFLNNRCL